MIVGEKSEKRGYRDSHLAPGKGEAYQRMFRDNPHRRMVWEFEKSILDRIQEAFFAGREIHHLDFACGTGRILRHFEDRTATSVGVDVSPGMLEVASRNNESSELYHADLTRNDILGERKFNLITAFRFFANAEPRLRSEAMQVIVRHLDKNGCLVFNNHRNSGCLKYRLSRLLGRTAREGMSLSAVRELLVRHDLEILQIYHLGVFPASESRMLLPWFILRHIEGLLARFSVLRNLAENLVYVCRHSRQ